MRPSDADCRTSTLTVGVFELGLKAAVASEVEQKEKTLIRGGSW